MNAKECVAAYCKAQAELNTIEKENEDNKKQLNERIKTCRSLITDELMKKNISCFEIYEEGVTEPLYFRLKQNLPNMNISIEDLMTALQSINREMLSACAEKHENDLPKMISSSIQSLIREAHKNKVTEDKVSLQISTNRERGYQRNFTQQVSEDTLRIAHDLIHARKELGSLKQKQSEKKKSSIAIQKEVESTVKEALKKADPSNMTTRIHMAQNDNEWVYYLRCKEFEKKSPIGIRRILPMVEKAMSSYLDTNGLPRHYTTTFNLDEHFFHSISLMITKTFEEEANEMKMISKLSLDRGAPRQRKK